MMAGQTTGARVPVRTAASVALLTRSQYIYILSCSNFCPASELQVICY